MPGPHTDVETLPMFPLGTVLFPSMLLPLRIFEPRYRAMIHDCLAADGRFGVVMIERGSEVGGGDTRSDVGCVASVVQAQERPDGQWLLMAMGTSRLRVREWLADDPYPRALVEAWCDGDGAGAGAGDRAGAAPNGRGGLEELVAHVDPTFRTVLALAAELDEWSVPLTMELDDDPALAIYQMSASSPLGPFDRQRLLVAPRASDRAELLGAMLDDYAAMLRSRLGSD